MHAVGKSDYRRPSSWVRDKEFKIFYRQVNNYLIDVNDLIKVVKVLYSLLYCLYIIR